jgi:predicted oxidoreductase
LPHSLQLSRIVAGTMKWGLWGNKFSTSQYLRIIEQCLELGVTSFDHADVYGEYTTEEEFGKALKENPTLRNSMQLVSKCGIKIVSPNRPHHSVKSYDTSATNIVQSAEQSLQNLNTDFLDVLLIHRPDPLMHPDEIAEAFNKLQSQGKVLHFGVSNFSPSQFELIHSRFPLVINQIEISIVHLDPFLDGTLDLCLNKNIIPMAWSPLGGGNIFNGSLQNDRVRRITATATMLAEKYLTTPDLILLSWLLKHPSNIIPVLGTSKIDRIASATQALDICLSREDWFYLWRASTGKEVS